MNDRRTTYSPRSDATPEGELNALAAVYKFLLVRRAQKQAVDQGTQSHAKKEVEHYVFSRTQRVPPQ